MMGVYGREGVCVYWLSTASYIVPTWPNDGPSVNIGLYNNITYIYTYIIDIIFIDILLLIDRLIYKYMHCKYRPTFL